MTAFAIFVLVGSSFRLASTAIVAETEKSPYSFFSFQDLFSPTAHWPYSLLGIIYPGNFRDKCEGYTLIPDFVRDTRKGVVDGLKGEVWEEWG